MPDQPRQEVGTTGFHDEPAARKHEADFCFRVGDTDVHGEGHGYADANGGALEGGYGGFAAVVDCERYFASSVQSTLASKPTNLPNFPSRHASDRGLESN